MSEENIINGTIEERVSRLRGALDYGEDVRNGIISDADPRNFEKSYLGRLPELIKARNRINVCLADIEKEEYDSENPIIKRALAYLGKPDYQSH